MQLFLPSAFFTGAMSSTAMRLQPWGSSALFLC